MEKLAKDILSYCVGVSSKEMIDAVTSYIQNGVGDVNFITLKVGNVVFWVGACINKFQTDNVKIEAEDKLIISAFRAAVNALKHNSKIVEIAQPATVISPLCGAYSAGGSSPFSRFHRHTERTIVWRKLPKKSIHSGTDINAFNEILAMHDVCEGINLIKPIIEKYLNKL